MMIDYGKSWGPLFWRYALTRGVAMLYATGYEARWYGLNLSKNVAFGIIIRRPLTPDDR